jgi:hypothetical protein
MRDFFVELPVARKLVRSSVTESGTILAGSEFPTGEGEESSKRRGVAILSVYPHRFLIPDLHRHTDSDKNRVCPSSLIKGKKRRREASPEGATCHPNALQKDADVGSRSRELMNGSDRSIK